jgi:hypothetical protein
LLDNYRSRNETAAAPQAGKNLGFLLFEEKSSAPERRHPALKNVTYFFLTGEDGGG